MLASFPYSLSLPPTLRASADPPKSLEHRGRRRAGDCGRQDVWWRYQWRQTAGEGGHLWEDVKVVGSWIANDNIPRLAFDSRPARDLNRKAGALPCSYPLALALASIRIA